MVKAISPQSQHSITPILQFSISLDEIDLFPLFQRHDGLFPVRFAAVIRTPLAFLFPGIITGVYIYYFLLE